MAFRKVCTLDDLWEGDMTEVELDGEDILLVWPEQHEVQAYQAVCPHQDIPLAEGKFDGRVMMCRAHQWTFDGKTGQGINPKDCKLARYAVKVEGDDVYVDTEGVTPLFAHS
jgi:toluene monooxygenase system ferredoxin subunit